MGSEVLFFLINAQFFPNIFSMNTYGLYGYFQQLGYLFGSFSMLYQVCHPDLCRRQFQVFG